jgi:hypothetical protein
MINYIFLVFVYLFFGRALGFEIYRHEVLDFLIEKKLLNHDHIHAYSMHTYSSLNEFEKKIKPKWYRNILRIISIILWPILFIVIAIYMIVSLIGYLIISFIEFFTE